MKILITAGGTSEPIDSVRKITNRSSGHLGSVIANTLLSKNEQNIEKIYYICTKNSIKPKNSDKISQIIVESTQEVFDALQKVLTTEHIDIVIHSMAISDYKVDYISSSEILTNALSNCQSEEIKNKLSSSAVAINNSKKISSNFQDLFIHLVPTPKIISYIKKWSPNSTLVGFKLLSGVTKEELLSVATNLLRKNQCDYVVANDLKEIKNDKHTAYIVNKDLNIQKATSKQEIALLLNQNLFNSDYSNDIINSNL